MTLKWRDCFSGVNELRAVKKHAPAGYTSSAADLLPQIFAVEQFEMSTMDTDLHQQKFSSPFVMRFAARNAQEMEAWVRQIDLMANLYGCAAVSFGGMLGMMLETVYA